MTKRSVGAALLVLPMAATGVLAALPRGAQSASANSAPPYWEGQEASGVIVTGEDCPVEVEQETLSLDIVDLPLGTGFEDYRSSVTAEYTFYNPETYDVTMTLLFPFGVMPDYFSGEDDSGRYAVLRDGEAVDLRVRHTYKGYRSFYVDDMRQVSDALREDEFYEEKLAVSAYTVRVDAPAEDCYVDFTFYCNPLRTRVAFADHYVRTEIVDGMGKATVALSASKQDYLVTVYAIGEKFRSLEAKVRGANEGSAASFLLDQPVSETTFYEFVMQHYPAETAVSATDWYNATVDMFNAYTAYDYIVYVATSDLDESMLMRWYEYSLTVPAEGRTVNIVRAPLYPSAESGGKYMYEYLLSPAQKWADFKSISIRITTEYQLYNSSLTFVEEEGGYSFTRDNLPQGELTFTLHSAEEGGSGMFPIDNFLQPIAKAAIAALVVILVLTAVGVTLAVVLSRNSEKRRAADAARREMGTPRQGTLPPEPAQRQQSAPPKENGKDGKDE